MASDSDITKLLQRGSDGDIRALDELLPLVYDELRRRASVQMRGERAAHTLGTTGLVHEAVLRLAGQGDAQWVNRAQFYALASMTMRRILVNWARDRRRLKRGEGITPLPLDQIEVAGREPDVETVLAVDQALIRLSNLSPRAVRVVECRYFAGLSVDETAAALETSTSTVKREWRLARAWLMKELASDGQDLVGLPQHG